MNLAPLESSISHNSIGSNSSSKLNSVNSRINAISRSVFDDPLLNTLDQTARKSTGLAPLAIDNMSSANGVMSASVSMPTGNVPSANKKMKVVVHEQLIRRESINRVRGLVKKLDEEKRKHEERAAELAVGLGISSLCLLKCSLQCHSTHYILFNPCYCKTLN